MKRRVSVLPLIAVIVFAAVSCDKVRDKEVITVKLGAQENNVTDGFYAVEENATYTMAESSVLPEKIDIFCFYESETGNNIALASPGTGITGIFTGDNAPDTWATKNTTSFIVTALTAEQFEAVQEGDALIVSSFDAANARRKAKDLQEGQVWSFMTSDGIYGLLLVTEVKQGADGEVAFILKTRKIIDGR